MRINSKQKDLLVETIQLTTESLTQFIADGFDPATLSFYLECSISQPCEVFLETLDKLYSYKSAQTFNLIIKLKLINDLYFNNEVRVNSESDQTKPALSYWFASKDTIGFAKVLKWHINVILTQLVKNEIDNIKANSQIELNVARHIAKVRIDWQKALVTENSQKSIPDNEWRKMANLPETQLPKKRANHDPAEKKWQEFLASRMQQFKVAANTRVNQLDNGAMNKALIELQQTGLSVDHLKLWDRLSRKKVSQQENKFKSCYYSTEHTKLLASLIREQNLKPEQALLEMVGVDENEAIILQNYYKQGMRLHHLQKWQTNRFGGFTKDHVNTLVFLIDKLGFNFEDAIQEINQLNATQVTLLPRFFLAGLRGVHLRMVCGYQNEFTPDHQFALIKLIEKYHLHPKDAIQEMLSLYNVMAINTLAHLYPLGLRGEHMRSWVPKTMNHYFTAHHKRTLEYLITERQLSPDAAIKELNMLDETQAIALRELHFRGLRGDDLRKWRNKGGEGDFGEEHLKALTHLVLKGEEFEDAFRHISELSKNEVKDIYTGGPLPNFSTDKSLFFSGSIERSRTVQYEDEKKLNSAEEINKLHADLSQLDEIFKREAGSFDRMKMVLDKIDTFNKIAKNNSEIKTLFDKILTNKFDGAPLNKSDFIDLLMDNWFSKEELKLMVSGAGVLAKRDVKAAEFYSFAQDLAVDMKLANTATISPANKEIWLKYFANNDPAITRGRIACPLYKEGNTYRFAYPLLLEYFCAKKTVVEMPKLVGY